MQSTTIMNNALPTENNEVEAPQTLVAGEPILTQNEVEAPQNANKNDFDIQYLLSEDELSKRISILTPKDIKILHYNNLYSSLIICCQHINEIPLLESVYTDYIFAIKAVEHGSKTISHARGAVSKKIVDIFMNINLQYLGTEDIFSYVRANSRIYSIIPSCSMERIYNDLLTTIDFIHTHDYLLDDVQDLIHNQTFGLERNKHLALLDAYRYQFEHTHTIKVNNLVIQDLIDHSITCLDAMKIWISNEPLKSINSYHKVSNYIADICRFRSERNQLFNSFNDCIPNHGRALFVIYLEMLSTYEDYINNILPETKHLNGRILIRNTITPQMYKVHKDKVESQGLSFSKEEDIQIDVDQITLADLDPNNKTNYYYTAYTGKNESETNLDSSSSYSSAARSFYDNIKNKATDFKNAAFKQFNDLINGIINYVTGKIVDSSKPLIIDALFSLAIIVISRDKYVTGLEVARFVMRNLPDLSKHLIGKMTTVFGYLAEIIFGKTIIVNSTIVGNAGESSDESVVNENYVENALLITHTTALDLLQYIFDIPEKTFSYFKNLIPDAPRMKEISTISKAIVQSSNMLKAMIYVIEFIKTTYEWFYYKITGKPFLNDLNRNVVNATEKWLLEAQKIHKECQPKNVNVDAHSPLVVDSVLCEKVLQHYREAERITHQLLRVSSNRPYMSIFRDAVNKYKPLYDEADLCLKRSGLRAPPLAINIVGLPGVGKSVISNTVIKALRAHHCKINNLEFDSSNADGLTFPKQMSDPRFEGYMSHFAMTLDDCFQHDDKDVMTMNALAIINMVSNNTYQLDMATLEKKSTTFFNSRVLLLTNNSIISPSNLHLADVEALHRRIHVTVKMQPKEKYITHDGKLSNDDNFDMDKWYFVRLDSSGQHVGDTMDFEQFLYLLYSEYTNLQNTASALAKSLTNYQPPSFEELAERNSKKAKVTDVNWLPLNLSAQSSEDINKKQKKDQANSYREVELINRIETRINNIVKDYSKEKDRKHVKHTQKQMEDDKFTQADKTSTKSAFDAFKMTRSIAKKFSNAWIDSHAYGRDDYPSLDMFKEQPLIAMNLWGRIDLCLVLNGRQPEILTMKGDIYAYCSTKYEHDNRLLWHETLLGNKLAHELSLKKQYRGNYLEEIISKDNELRDSWMWDIDQYRNIMNDLPEDLDTIIDELKKRISEVRPENTHRVNAVLNHVLSNFSVEKVRILSELLKEVERTKRLRDPSWIPETIAQIEKRRKELQEKALKNGSAFLKKIETNFSDNLLSFISKDFVKICSGLILAAGTFLGCLYTYRTIYELIYPSTIEGQKGVSEGYAYDKPRKHADRKYPTKTVQRFEQQSIPESNEAYNALLAKITRNTAAIYRIDRNDDGTVKKTFLCCGLFVRDNWLLTVNHLVANEPYEIGVDILSKRKNVIRDKELYIFNTGDVKIASMPKDDVALIRIPNVQPFPDIVKDFADSTIIDNMNGVFDKITIIVRHENRVEIRDANAFKTSIRYPAGSKGDCYVNHALEYETNNKFIKGHCGSVVVLANNLPRPMIAGLHVAGDMFACIGYGGIVTRDALDAYFNSIAVTRDKIVEETLNEYDTSVESQCAGEVEVSEGSCSYTLPTERATYLGDVRSDLATRMPNKSDIVPSLLHGLVQKPLTRPGQLGKYVVDGVLQSPMQNGLNRMNIPISSYRIPLKIKEEVKDLILSLIKTNVNPKPFSDDKVIHGDNTLNFIPPINMHTSPGFMGVNRATKGSGKEWLYEGDLQARRVGPHLRELLDNRIAQIRDSGKCETIFEMCLKDAKVSFEKYEQGRTRLFACAPHDHFFLGKKYCGSFMEALSNSSKTTGIAVGINPHSTDWFELYKRTLGRVGWKHFDGDYKEYDYRNHLDCDDISKSVMHDWYEITANLYLTKGLISKEEYDEIVNFDQKIRHALLYSSFDEVKVLIGRNLLLLKFIIMSGTFITFLRNSLNNMARFYSCIKIACAEFSSESNQYVATMLSKTTLEVEYYRAVTNNFDSSNHALVENFYFATGGDDFIADVNTSYQFYDRCVDAHYASLLGYVITTSSKNGLLTPWVDIDDITFYKRKFVFRDGLMFGPMELEHVLDILNWQDKVLPQKDALVSLVNSVMIELVHHGKFIYEKYRILINHYLLNMKIKPYLIAYEQHVSDFFMNDIKYNTIEPQSAVTDTSAVEPEITEETDVTTFRDVLGTSFMSTAGQRFQDIHSKADPYELHGLESSIEREYLVQTLTWSSTQARDTRIATYYLPYALLNTSGFIRDKLRNFEFWRADVEVTLRTNATTFHSGRLMVSWLPKTPETTTNPSWKFGNIYTMSNCPTTFLSASTQEVIKFLVPYVSMKPFHKQDNNGNINETGSITIRVLNELSMIGAASTVNLTVSVFMKFVNVYYAAPTIHAQTGESMEKTETGIVSETLNAVSGVSGFVSTLPLPNPTMNIGASILSSIARKGATLARKMGYGKPQYTGYPEVRTITDAGSLSLGSGMYADQDLGMTVDNNVASTPNIFGRTDDEMILSRLAAKPGLALTSSFNSTTVHNQVLLCQPVRPFTGATWKNSNATPQYKMMMTPVAAVAYNFRYWRGGMKYSLETICSKMVSCRLRVTWHPTMSEAPSVGAIYSDDDLGDLISTVFDVMGDTITNFEIPYLQDSMYSMVQEIPQMTGLPEENANGCFTLSVVNPPVVNTSTVADSKVWYNLYVAGSEDMSFFCARARLSLIGSTQYNRTFSVVNGPTAGNVPTGGTWALIGQAGGYADMLEDRFMHNFPPLIPIRNKIIFHGINTGEEILHVKQLMSRFENLTFGTLSLSAYLNLGIKDIPTGNGLDSFKQLFMNWFLYRKGSVHYKIMRTSIGTTNYGMLEAMQVDYSSIGTAVTATSYEGVDKNGLAREYLATNKATLEVRLPHYSRNAFVHCNQTLALADESDETTVAVRFVPVNTSLPTLDVVVKYAFGDDFAFGWACGAPILSIN